MAQNKISKPLPFGNKKLPKVSVQFLGQQEGGGGVENISEFEFSYDELDLQNRLVSFEYTLVDSDAADTSLKYKLTIRNPDNSFDATVHKFYKSFLLEMYSREQIQGSNPLELDKIPTVPKAAIQWGYGDLSPEHGTSKKHIVSLIAVDYKFTENREKLIEATFVDNLAVDDGAEGYIPVSVGVEDAINAKQSKGKFKVLPPSVIISDIIGKLCAHQFRTFPAVNLGIQGEIIDRAWRAATGYYGAKTTEELRDKVIGSRVTEEGWWIWKERVETPVEKEEGEDTFDNSNVSKSKKSSVYSQLYALDEILAAFGIDSAWKSRNPQIVITYRTKTDGKVQGELKEKSFVATQSTDVKAAGDMGTKLADAHKKFNTEPLEFNIEDGDAEISGTFAYADWDDNLDAAGGYKHAKARGTFPLTSEDKLTLIPGTEGVGSAHSAGAISASKAATQAAVPEHLKNYWQATTGNVTDASIEWTSQGQEKFNKWKLEHQKAIVDVEKEKLYDKLVGDGILQDAGALESIRVDTAEHKKDWASQYTAVFHSPENESIIGTLRLLLKRINDVTSEKHDDLKIYPLNYANYKDILDDVKSPLGREHWDNLQKQISEDKDIETLLVITPSNSIQDFLPPNTSIHSPLRIQSHANLHYAEDTTVGTWKDDELTVSPASQVDYSRAVLSYGSDNSIVTKINYKNDGQYFANLVSIPVLGSQWSNFAKSLTGDKVNLYTRALYKEVSLSGGAGQTPTKNVGDENKKEMTVVMEDSALKSLLSQGYNKRNEWKAEDRKRMLKAVNGGENITEEDSNNFRTFLGFVKNAAVIEAIFGYYANSREDSYSVTTTKAEGKETVTTLKFTKSAPSQRYIKSSNTFDKFNNMDARARKSFLNDSVFNMIGKTQLVSHITFQCLGIPEMDTLAEVISPRILDIRVHDSDEERLKRKRVLHPMLTGIYRPISIKHTLSTAGYFTDITCFRVVGSTSDALVEKYEEAPKLSTDRSNERKKHWKAYPG